MVGGRGLRSFLRQFLAVALLVLAVLALLAFCAVRVPSVRGDENSSSLGDADAALRQAFAIVLDAESAGANVSGLILRLNEAGIVLSKAEIALGNGNSSEAANEAGQCVGIADGVKNDAVALKASTLDEARTTFRTYLIFSVVSVAVFVVVLAVVWRRFRRGYVGKALGAKPEVVSGES
jgi:membrane protein implicated in regulation of membrane protease activity